MPLPADSIRLLTRHPTVDADFAAVLEERFGIPGAYILRALKGEPRQRAVALCRLTRRYEEPNGTLMILPRKFGSGRARRQRTAGMAPYGHGEASPRPSMDRSGPGRGCATTAGRLLPPERL